MLKSFLKSGVIITIALTVLYSIAFAQPPNPRAKERVMQLKKIKLLEILDLDEKTSEKFLAKYTSWEKKIIEKRDHIDLAMEDLEKSIRRDAPKEELIAKSAKAMAEQKEMESILFQAQNDMKSMLNETQFAKLIVFEHRFRGELQKVIMERMRKQGKND